MNPGWRKNYLRYKSYFLNVIARYKDRADVKAYLELLLSLLTISVFSIFALRPTIVTIAQLLKEIETKKETIAKMDDKIKRLSEAQSLFDRERNQITLLLIAVPTKPNLDDFTRQVLGVVNKDQVNTSLISVDNKLGSSLAEPTASPSASLAKQDLKYIVNVNAPLENFGSILNFISDFEKLRQPPIIDALQISVTTLKQSQQLTLNLVGRAPYLPNIPK